MVGIFLFGIQTYFLSKILVYLIRITIFSIDNSLLEQEIFIIFYFGLNIIDWFAIVITIVLQTLFFTVGMQYNKKLINFSAMTVYAGMLIFFFVILLSDVKVTTEAFSNIFKLYIKYSEDIKEKPITLCTLVPQKQNKSFQFQVL